MKDPREFVRGLADENAAFWRDRDVRQDPSADAPVRLAQLRARMRQGVYNELRSVELIAAWLPHVPEREIRDLLQEEAARGRSILLNSHLLSEIERTCDRVAILRSGRIVAEGRIDELTSSGSRYRLVATGVDDRLIAALRDTGASIDRVNGHFDLTTRDLDHVNVVIDRLRAGGARLQELAPVKSSLEDVFVELVKAGGDPNEGVS